MACSTGRCRRGSTQNCAQAEVKPHSKALICRPEAMSTKKARRQELKVVLPLAAPAELQRNLLTKRRHNRAGNSRGAALGRNARGAGAPNRVQDRQAQGMPGEQPVAARPRRPRGRLSSDNDGWVHGRAHTSQALPNIQQPRNDRPVSGTQQEQVRVGFCWDR